MPVPIVADPVLDRPLSLVRFAVEVWLHRLLGEAPLFQAQEVGLQTSDAMLARIATDERELERYGRGLQALVDASGPAKPPKRSDPVTAERALATPTRRRRRVADDAAPALRALIRALDDHLVRTRPGGRVHLLSFYESAVPHGAGRTDWVDPRAFYSAWAAGHPRSKYEVLDRGRHAAALVSQRGDDLREDLAKAASPSSPYRRGVTLQKLLEDTVRGLVAIVCLPASSGGPAASRHLAAIGGIALNEVERYVFGEPGSTTTPRTFGTPDGWRLVRVLAVIGQLYQQPDAASAVWGHQRAAEVRDQAMLLLRRVVAEEVPVVSRERSLPIEAYRELDDGDPELYEIVRHRLTWGRIVDDKGASVAPFGEVGLLGTREQAYTALVLAEKNVAKVPDICKLLRKNLRIKEFEGLDVAVRAARNYAAAYIEYRFGVDGERLKSEREAPPLDAFLSQDLLEVELPVRDDGTLTKEGANLDARRKKVERWFHRDGSSEAPDGHVRAAAFAVWDALRSAADPRVVDGELISGAWRHKDLQVARFAHGTEADRLLVAAKVPVHARHALRSLVAQTVLSIDGSTRREGIEALRQSGQEAVAAELFALVVRRCRAIAAKRGEKKGHPLDHLREQAVFCLSYTGALDAFDTLVEEAGLTQGRRESEGRRPDWTDMPDVQPEHLRWIRTTALLGLADLGDQLHDATGDKAKARIDFLLHAITLRLQQLARELPKPRVGPPTAVERALDHVAYVEGGEERRALVSVLAMLRSEESASINLLHVLSGSTYDTPDRNTPKAPSRVRRKPVGDELIFLWQQVPQEEWQALHANELAPIDDGWDLASWQLAQWGLDRITRRFTNPPKLVSPNGPKDAPEIVRGDGVRLTDPLASAQKAEARMRALVAANFYEAGRTARMPELDSSK